MCNNSKDEKQQNKKGFFAKLFEKLDKKMEEKPKGSCCCNKENSEDKTC